MTMVHHQTTQPTAFSRAFCCAALSLSAILLILTIVQDTHPEMVYRGTEISLSADQGGTVSRYGYPDSFTIVITRGDPSNPGRIFRLETWNYYREQRSLVFVNGLLKGPVSSAVMPPGRFERKTYRPEQFVNEMTWQEVHAKIFGIRASSPAKLPRGYHLSDLGGILLGFENGRLVYVDTTPLEADED